MKLNRIQNTVYLIALAVATTVVVFDTFQYYRHTAQAETFSSTASTSLSNELRQQEATTPTPSPTPSAPMVEYRVTSFNDVETVTLDGITAAQTSFLHSTRPSTVTSIEVFEIKYEIKGKDGSWQPVSAAVYVPINQEKLPLFVFGSGTTGIADKCAPSLENIAVENLGNYRNQMISQAAEGYVTVFPNYEGFDSPEFTQAYFVAESEAKTLLAAVLSLVELQPQKQQLQVIDFTHVFLSGYSQGGHAALSSAQNWQSLPSSIQLSGIIEFAGAANVHALFLDSPWLASYLVESYTEYYGSNLQAFQVLQGRWLQDMASNNDALCVNAAYKHYPKDKKSIYTPAFIDALESNTWPQTLSSWQQAIVTNTPLSSLPNVPHLSIQGATDPIVTATTQQQNIERLCQDKHQVGYKEYPGINHFDIRRAGFEFSNTWMKEVLTGATPFSSCLPS